jgi:hypothetical protein
MTTTSIADIYDRLYSVSDPTIAKRLSLVSIVRFINWPSGKMYLPNYT